MTEPKTSRKASGWLVPAGILLIAALLLALVVLQVRDQTTPPAAEAGGETMDGLTAVPPERPELKEIERRDPDDVEAAGPEDAPVALVVFSDYQCPFCAKWSQDTLPEMMEYAEAGDLRIEWRDINMYGEPSERAARAAHAAGLQGQYWEFHDALYAGGEHRPADQLTDEALQDLAGQLGLDVDRFVADMGSAAVREQVEKTAQEGRDLGVTGTPSFILDGRAVVGAQPSSVFTDIIENALSEKD
ncbi:DsbA family protein [Microbacterium sp. ZW T5_45]|uniref:DsbA family protein n=1 Tax=Microbacterium sp. ZW T5_45 TaxID=3378080 RepID=UPI003852AF6D